MKTVVVFLLSKMLYYRFERVLLPEVKLNDNASNAVEWFQTIERKEND